MSKDASTSSKQGKADTRHHDGYNLWLQVANRWEALLFNPRCRKLAIPKHSFVHTDGVAITVMCLQHTPAAPPAELPRMGRHMGSVNPLAHFDAEWLGVDLGKTNMATVAHEERSADGLVVSMWHGTRTAGQYYRVSGITRLAQVTKTWPAQVNECQVPAVLWQATRGGIVLVLTSFRGSSTIGCRGAPVSQMLKEALRQFPAGRVLMVDDFRTSRVAAASEKYGESFTSPGLDVLNKQSQHREQAMCGFYDRDVSVALNICRCESA
ncbi:hypothetical protein QJQ45_015377 [Haematococcus lacustris]|nr:hypothetical protein QJQ45_015377 [Haematococcus lacustris]